MRFLILILFAASLSAARAEDKFPTLQVGKHVYTNVTVTTHGKNSIFIMHATGMATIYLSDLSPELQKQLGYVPGSEKAEKTKSSFQLKKFAASFSLPKTGISPRSAFTRGRRTAEPTSCTYGTRPARCSAPPRPRVRPPAARNR